MCSWYVLPLSHTKQYFVLLYWPVYYGNLEFLIPRDFVVWMRDFLSISFLDVVVFFDVFVYLILLFNIAIYCGPRGLLLE